jgi:demethoxyubiquinone hydroxylase (CLK1/Coq7/Cat5 family)
MQTNVPSQTTTKDASQSTTKDASVEKLEECLRGELSAVETYELALKGIDHVGLHHTLQEILASHARRTELLSEKIGRLGADPPKSSGIWGAFAKVVQAGADLLGDRAAIAALEEGEDRGLRLYKENLEGCNAKTRKLIETKLLPEQERTHELCRSLKQYMAAPS